MTEFKDIALKDIHVPERLRAVDESYAEALSSDIGWHGLHHPITVRFTPAQKLGKYTLVAGAHRYRGFELLQRTTIPAKIIEADADDALLVEVGENLFRNELTTLDRAIFVQKWREGWEAKYGKIQRGGDPEAKGKNYPLLDGKPVGFAKHVAARMGISEEALKLLNRISRQLNSHLRDQLRNTEHANDQSTLLKLAKFEPKKQAEIAVGLQFGADLETTLKAVDGSQPKQDSQTVLLSRLIDTWRRASATTKAKFVEHIRPDIETDLDEAA